jgi:type VI protein secretion system component Hcp
MIPTIMMALRKASGEGGLLYVQYIFRHNYITGITWSGGEGNEPAWEVLHFSFKAMGMQFIGQAPDGSGDVRKSWSWNTSKQAGVAGSAGLSMGGDKPPDYLPDHVTHS